jgi:TetR/AcrR family transcriptional regulator, transcriptional repressor for nem operon
MARPREFDETAVLQAAMQRFWAHGYEPTSVRDLAAHMGLTGASLYNAFGDKRSLYRRALSYYVAQIVGDRVRHFEKSLPPLAAIKAFFDEIIEGSLNDRQRKGCMLVNSSLELVPHDRAFRRLVAAALSEVEGFFLRCVTAGQTAGTISQWQSAADLARCLLGALLGIRVLARARPERDLLEGLVRPVFAMLEAPNRERI